MNSVPPSLAEFARQRRIEEQRLKDYAVSTLKQTYAEAMVQLLNSVHIGLSQWASRLSGALKQQHQAKLQSDLSRMAKMAQARVRQAYGASVVQREGAASRTHYRAGQGRLAGGILLRALSRSDFFTVSGSTLAWGDMTMLDASARQWARIAFGAGGRGKGIQDTFPVTFDGMVLGTVGLSGEPSPGFSMPVGIWVRPGTHKRVTTPTHIPGSDAFYPYRGSTPQPREIGRGIFTMEPSLSASEALRRLRGRPQKLRMNQGRVPTRGIRSHDFFKAGLRYIASDPQGGLPKVLEDYVYNITKSWPDAAKMRKTVRVVVAAKGR